MKVYNNKINEEMDYSLTSILKNIRKERNFNAKEYIKLKASNINKYMRICDLKVCVVALSGGVDSSIVYGILKQAQKEESSPIEKVIGVTLPAIGNSGVTNQEDTVARVSELGEKYDDEIKTIDMTGINEEIQKVVNKEMGINGDDWAKGQLVPYSRTSVLYYITSLLTQIGKSGILVGTTNLDEGGYLGYVGKASDGMVDVQLISDIHKSEVYAVAIELGLPESIIKAIPTGDMYDNREDIEVFGASYDFVELYLNYLNLSEEEREKCIGGLTEEGYKQFQFWGNNLENLHRYNSHKYLGLSPAVHLDLYTSSIKGGWIDYKENYDRWLTENGQYENRQR